ncbi:ATP-binding cassette sub-family B member 10, mitochondrial [Daktulosphaira vitifoliae]|uniref:ATP-binding cassette sub-family B member 10, mitochondrial n=1 Tax=Daktulosphaira vitifoliae TaxID=58002 RepID=UPI0021AA3A73|nr:ATP-binding cassette sub-family B member 10, mitochondrial [Daktulosphaira vitifoliae]
MNFSLLRYSLSAKLKVPLLYRNLNYVIGISGNCRFKPPLKTFPVRWVNTKNSNKVSKQVLSASKIIRLYSLAKPEKTRLIYAVCLLLVSSTVTMAIPFSFGRIVDIIYKSDASETQSKLIKVCTILLPVFLIGAACNFGRIYFMSTSGYRITKRLRELLFKSLISQETAYFDRHKTGELINRLSSDCLIVSQTVTNNISDGLRSTIMVVCGVSFMFAVSSKLALIGLSIIPPVAGAAIIYGRFVRKITRSVQDSLAASNQVAEEKISNIRTVKVFSQEKKEMFRYEEKMNEVLGLSVKESLMRGLFFAMTGFAGNFVIIAVLYSGGLMVSEQAITVGELTSFLMYAAYTGVSIGGLSSFYSDINKGLGASSRIWEIIDRKPLIPIYGGIIPKKELKGDINFQNIAFSYPNRPDISIFNGLSLHIPQGKSYALVGHSGTGKSTLGHLLLRLYDPLIGEVCIDQMDIKFLDSVWLHSHIGVVSQEPVLFSGTIRENIMYGNDNATENEIIDAAKEANAFNFIVNKFPDGFDTVVGERGILLSGGQKQRIAISRALLKNPKIVLLDEATSALDSESEKLIQEALQRVSKGRTVLTIAHRLSTIKNADKLAVLHNGKITELDTYDNLMALEDGLFRKINKNQMLSSDG